MKSKCVTFDVSEMFEFSKRSRRSRKGDEKYKIGEKFATGPREKRLIKSEYRHDFERT